jgi:hypothetical protein
MVSICTSDFTVNTMCWTQNFVFGDLAKLRKATVSFIVSVCLFVRMEQLGSHWTYFHETLYWRIFRKYVEKIQVALKSDKNNEYFTLRHVLICVISFILLRLKKIFQTKVVEKIKTHFLCSVTFFFSKIVPFVWWCGKILQRRTVHRWQYGACALQAEYLKLQKHSQNI